MGTVIKLLLSICAALIGWWQFLQLKTIGTAFCFVVAAVLFLGFLMDLVRLALRKRKKALKAQAAPAPSDYPDAPDPGDLKRGNVFRAVNVENYLSNIRSLLEETPEYKLTESELIDSYLTDKKIWQYSFHPKAVTLQEDRDSAGNVHLNILMDGKQVGMLPEQQCRALLQARKDGKQVEVVYCSIGGGPYKVITEDVHTGQYQMQTEEKPYSVTLSIYIS